MAILFLIPPYEVGIPILDPATSSVIYLVILWITTLTFIFGVFDWPRREKMKWAVVFTIIICVPITFILFV